MDASKYNWSTLLEKYQRGDISEEELAELHRQMDASLLKRKQFEEVTAPDYDKKSLMEFQKADTNKNWQKLIEQLPHLRPSPVVRITQHKIMKYTVAACILVIAVVTYYRYRKKDSTSQPANISVAVLQEPAVKPYSYVYLSTGQEFRLKELADGVLFNANGATIRIKDSLIVVDTNGISKVHDETVFAMVTAPKRQEKLMLPDGSVFTLDAASYIVFKLYGLGRKRAVRIYGQAYCEVNKTNKPFAVQLNDSVNVVVTGTRFNVRNYKNENPKIALVSGKVMLTRGSQTCKMQEGQTVELNKEKKFVLINDADVENATAWKEQEFSFDDKNIFEMMDQVGPFYNYPVVFASDSMPDTKSWGRIPIYDNPDSTAHVIAIQYDVRVEVRNDSFIVSKKKPL